MFDHIVIFIQLIEIGSFAKTAEYLKLAPSTLSRKIQELESYFGKLLLIRDTRNISLSEEGKIVYQKFKTLSDQLNSVKKTINPTTRTGKDTLKIILPLVHSLELITPYIDCFNKTYPNIKLLLIYQNIKTDVDNFDIAVSIHPNENKNYEQRFLRTELIQLYCTPAYAIKNGLPIVVEDLNQHSIIGGIDAKNNVIDYATLTNKYTKESFIYNSNKDQIKTNSAIHSLKIGLKGEFIFPSWSFLCNELVTRGELIQVLPEYYGYKDDLYLITRKSTRPEEQLFIDFIYRCMNKMITFDNIYLK